MILAVLLLCGGILAGSLAEGQYEYTAKGKNAEITLIKGAGEIEIPAELDGKKVTSIYYYAFNGNNNVTKVTLPEGLQKIDMMAFANSGSLKSPAGSGDARRWWSLRKRRVRRPRLSSSVRDVLSARV